MFYFVINFDVDDKGFEGGKLVIIDLLILIFGLLSKWICENFICNCFRKDRK